MDLTWLCSQTGCPEPGTWRVFWPGHPPRLMCDRHREQAIAVGDAMGCYVHSEPLTPEQAK